MAEIDHTYAEKQENELGTIRYKDASGEYHRHDGPAVITSSGLELWWWHGQSFSGLQFNGGWSDAKKAWWMRAAMSGNYK